MSTETKFTKGAWVAGRIEVNGVAIDKTWAVGVNGCTLAGVTSGPTFGIINEIQKANAQLIAAAPEMYAMIESLTRELNMAISEVNAMRDIKAAGNLTPADHWDKESCHDGQVLLAKARGESI